MPNGNIDRCDVCVTGLLSALPYKCGAWQEMRREIVVRNVVMENSTACQTATMTDCDVGECAHGFVQRCNRHVCRISEEC